jgi:Gas vesicle protein
MTHPAPRPYGSVAQSLPDAYGHGGGANLADILERVLDKGIVIAGDIRVNLLDIELLTIKLRLLVASVDKAREMGIDWWEHDPALSSGNGRAVADPGDGDGGSRGQRSLAEENRELRERLAALEARSRPGTGEESPGDGTGPREGAT